MRSWLVPVVCVLAIAGCDSPTAPRPANTGSVRGFVRGAADQALPGAVVKATSQTVTAAAPEAAANPDTDNGKDHWTVMHDFGDGHGRVLTDRVLLKYASPDGSKYLYLRAGEYFFEALPSGAQKLTATMASKDGSTRSAALDVTVTTDGTLADQNFKLEVPAS